jgi:CubicO group peptidase (beta-lactamase class C family)
MKSFYFLITLVLLTECTSRDRAVPGPGSELTPGEKTAIRTLQLKKADTFDIVLPGSTFVTGTVDQISVDVVVSILDSTRKEINRYDDPARGGENFFFESTEDGTYSIVVAPFQENVGDYTVVIRTIEPIGKTAAARVEQVTAAITGGDENAPGATVAVQQGGKIIYSSGFGHADLEYDIHNTPGTIFHIASVSKQFTAFSIAMLADQGKLSVDDDIRKYIPEMHDFGTPITINHLVHHTSGLRDQWNLLLLAGWRLDDVITQKQLMRIITRQRELNFQPGAEYVYCNTGYTLMAEIVARVTGESFTDWTKKNIFDPLAMKNTFFYVDHEQIVPNRAYSYYKNDKGVYKKAVLSYANAGATSLFTTVEDLSLWAVNFKTMAVGNSAVMEMMNRRFVLNNGDTINYAFGQVIDKYNGLNLISHNGADAGYRTAFLRFPDQDLSIAVFSNLASFSPGALANTIANVYLGDQMKPDTSRPSSPPPPAPEDPFDPSSVKLNDYTGSFYSSELQTTYNLEVVNDTLVAHHQRVDDIRFEPRRPNEFFARGMGNVVFTKEKGNVTSMFVTNGRVRNLRFEKK